MDPGSLQSLQSSRRPSLTLSELEVPITPSQTATLEQIHASNSAATGLTSFYLGSPPPAAPTPLTFNKLFSKVKSYTTGIKDAVREAVVVGPPGRSRSGTNDSRESFENFSVGGTSNRASPTTSNFQFRSRYNPNRLSNASIMTKGSSGSADGAVPSALRKVNILSPGPKSTPSPSLAQVTVFRDGMENSSGEGNSNGVVGKAVNGAGSIATVPSLPLPVSEQMTFNKRFSVLQDQLQGSDNSAKPGVDGTIEEDGLADNFENATYINSGVGGRVGNPNPSAEDMVLDMSQSNTQNKRPNQSQQSASPSPGTQVARSTNTSLPSPGQSHTLMNSSKRKSSMDALSSNKSMRKRPKSVKRTSESLLPGFTYNSESDTEDDDEDNTSSPADTSSVGGKTSMQRNGAKNRANRSTPSLIPGVGGVRALAGWFGVGGSISENQSSDRSMSGGATAPSSGGNIEAVGLALQQLRKGTLTKEFWMKDENCKDCFLCGKTFNAFRRKHHCRLCGQIFCAKCTTTISGERFGYNGSMKVCLDCQEIVKEYRDESDLERTNLQSLSIPEDMVSHTAGTVPGADNGFNPSFRMPAAHRPATTPLMAIPATRTTAGSNPNRRSAILEINSDKPSPPRPSSSRSMKAQIISSRPMTAASFKHSYQHNHHPHPHHAHYHKHTHNRSVHRWPGHNPNDRAPFHRNAADDILDTMNTLPAFHTDSVIDPELAPYMSDQDGTDDEQLSIFATIAPRNPDSLATSSMASPMLSAGTPQGDSGNAISVKNGVPGNQATSETGSSNPRNLPVKPAKRNSNFLNPLQTRAIPRGHRGIMRHIHSASDPMGPRPNISSGSPRVARSSSMRGPLASSIELNTASLQHVQNLLKQLLRDAGIQEVDKWEQALMPILLKSTDDLNPDVRAGDVIDIRHYIKVKRIPGGKPKDTSYVSGVVFTKNLALKNMARTINQPRIVIVTFPIEYQRAQQLISLEPVISQEKEFLQNMVNRIVALKPTLLLVGEHISGLALQYLMNANVATTYHVKSSVIQAVSRCAQADVFSSVDKLALSHFRIGRCARFEVKTFVHDDILPNKKKTFMFLSGCAKELGCTIVLRGADMDTLAIIKQITDLMVYVVYNLKLETCLMRDEFVLIPSTPKAPIPLPQSNTTTAAEDSLALGLEGASDPPRKEQETTPQSLEDGTIHVVQDKLPGGVPTPSYYEDMVKKHETKILSASPFVKYSQPYLLTTARALEQKLAYLRMLKDRAGVDEKTDEEKDAARDPEKYSDSEEGAPEKFELIQPKMLHEASKASKQAKEILRAIIDVEYEKALHVYNTQKKQWENYLAQYDDLFDPYAHQNIVILYTMVCTVTSVPCEGPEIRRLVFYDQGDDWPLGKSDCTLGQYVEYLCDTADRTCSTAACEKKMFDHHRSYVHGQARVSVLVNDKIASPNPGMKNTILMWSYCKICPNTNTPAIPMSESTWKYSFAKYLELAFWSSELKLRGGVCPHDLSRDHVRCFGYHGMTVVFQHDPIDLLEIFVPRTRITYKPELDLKVKNDQYILYEEKINRFMGSVRSRLASIKVETVAPEKHEACRAEVERLVAKCDEEQAWLIAKLQEKYTKSKYYEIIPMNRAMRAMQEKIVDWDSEFTTFDNDFFPSEKDIKRLAALQLRKLFLEPSTSDLPHEEITPSPEKEEGSKQTSVDGTATPLESGPTPIDLLSQATQDALASVMEEDATASEFQGKDAGQIANHSEVQPTVAETLTESPSVEESKQLGEESLSEERKLSEEISGIDQEQIPLEQVPTPSSNDQLAAIPAQIPPEQVSTPSSSEQLAAVPIQIPPEQVSTPSSSEKPAAIPIQIEGATPPQDPNPLVVGDTILDMKPRRRSISQHIARSGDVKALVAPSPTPPSSTGGGPRRKGSGPPPFGRTPSIPSGAQRKPPDGGALAIPHPRKSSDSGLSSASSGPRAPHTIATPSKKAPETTKGTSKSLDKPKTEKKLTDRLRSFSNKKSSRDKDAAIPRSVPNKLHRRDTKVTILAKQFEQLTKEFETERANQRKQLAAKRTKVYPVASTKPIVEVYKNVQDAVASEDNYPPPPVELPPVPQEVSEIVEERIEEVEVSESSNEIPPRAPTPSPTDVQDEEPVPPISQPHSDIEESDTELSLHSDHDISSLPSITDVLPPTPGAPDSELKELPRGHEKSSLMNILSKFWAERSASGWVQLDYPLAPTEHIFADSDVIVREDEPSSLIAFTLNSSDYVSKLQNLNHESSPYASMHNSVHQNQNSMGEHIDLERSLLKTTGTHIKYQFSEGSAKMYCKVFFAEQFDALRKNCGVGDRFAESLSRCGKWDSKGGKSKSVFLKTLDDRIVMKALQPVETQAFLKFAPAYFRFMSEAFFHELPTVIAKMLGFYQIFIKNPTTGTDIKWDVLVMENLFYDRRMTRIFDLKGSMRNRYAQATGDSGEVLLDENMVEFIYESPLFVREHAKKLLRASLWNDTLFLSKQNVMDYSLMIGIDENKKELVVGIIDCIRTFTWDKKLESWVKDLTGGGRNIRPTVTSPKEYKHRFREAMERYILEAPSCWHLFRMSWMSPVQVRLGTNNSQVRDPHHTSTEVATNTAGGAMATMAGSTPTQLSPPTRNGTPNATDDHVNANTDTARPDSVLAVGN